MDLSRAGHEHLLATFTTPAHQTIQFVPFIFENRAQNGHPKVSQSAKMHEFHHAFSRCPTVTDIATTIAVFSMNTLHSTLHVIPAMQQLQHLNMILTSTCVSFFQPSNVKRFQGCKSSQTDRNVGVVLFESHKEIKLHMKVGGKSKF
jgi:hypothetical protein